jgi:STE24 endopeptidase
MSGMRVGENVNLIEGAITLTSVGMMFIFAPELLKRVLNTQPLEAGSLRTRLENLCKRSGLRYRDILLWQTNNTMANAAVMGIVPRWRYILMSDLLLETMTDQQIEAVFAHEVGHIVHRHMAWYIVFFLIFMFAAAGPGTLVQNHLSALIELPAQLPFDLVTLTLGLAGFLLVFGYLSRRFEQQADVYAARTMQREVSLIPRPTTPAPSTSHVGEHGATVFASALRRVAVTNNIPIAQWSWCHGSIQKRINNILHLSRDPSLTGRFDRFMGRIYVTMLVALCACGTWVATIAF